MPPQPLAASFPASLPPLSLPSPPYSPSKPFPASALRYDASHNTPGPFPHPTLFVLKVYAAALTRSELTWSETLSPERHTPAIPGHDVCGEIVALPANYTSASTDEVARSRFKVGDGVFALLR